MPRGQSSSSGTIIVVIVAVLLLGVPVLLCGGCMLFGFALAPTNMIQSQPMQGVPVEVVEDPIDLEGPIDDATPPPDNNSSTEPE